MRWILQSGRLRYINDSKYRINWGKKSCSELQFAVKQFLKPFCQNHVFFEEYRLPGTLLRVDFLDATRKIAFEVCGKQHYEYVAFFSRNRVGYLNQFKRDVKKSEILEKNGYLLIIITKKDLPLTKNWFVEKYKIYL